MGTVPPSGIEQFSEWHTSARKVSPYPVARKQYRLEDLEGKI